MKPEFFGELTIIDSDFIKTKREVFYCGKKIAGALAASFEKVTNTHFYFDDERVYSYTLTDRMDKISVPKDARWFIPHAWYFADRNRIYHHSGWTNKIEPAGDDSIIERSHLERILLKNVWQNVEAKNDEEKALRRRLSGKIKSPPDLFRYIFPDANTAWNSKK